MSDNPQDSGLEPETQSNTVQISTPFDALQAIVLKPNPVFARLKNAHNWSWVAFVVVIFLSVLPTWLYFNMVDMDWYANMIVELQSPDVSPAEKDMARQMMMQENIAFFSAFVLAVWIAAVYAVFALYLHKMAQMDEENLLSFGDWYGFMWWATLPVAFVGAITALILVVAGGPETSPALLSPLALSTLLGLSMDSNWFSWAQGIGLDTIWVVYLIAVGLSQWTRLPTKHCFIIAAAPFVIIWGLWALAILF